MNQAAFTVTPLAEDFVRMVRTQRVDAFGNRVDIRHDDARHQCRSCLRLTDPGEPYLALAYKPFAGTHAFAEVGPVYLHLRECEPYSTRAKYPEEFPQDAVVLRAYGSNEEIVGARFVGSRPVEEVIGEMLGDERVAWIHARNSGYGCYMFRVDRAEG